MRTCRLIIFVLVLSACVPPKQSVPSMPAPTSTATHPGPILQTSAYTPTQTAPQVATPTPEPDILTIWGWRLLTFGHENLLSANLSLRLHEDGSLSGSTGCRPFHGAYQVSGEQFQLSGLETEGAPCTDPAQQDLERRYLEAMRQVQSFWLGEDLILTTPQDVKLNFMRELITADPPPGWESYIQAAYGFRFHYPTGWRVEALPDDPHRLRLVKGTLALTVGFRWLEEKVTITPSGMPAGDLQAQGGIDFLGSLISREALVSQGRVKAVLYNKGREIEKFNGLVLTASLEDQAQTPYEEIDISPAAQLQVDWALHTFQFLPQVEATPSYPTPTPWPVADPLQISLEPYAQVGQGTVQAVEWLADDRTLAVATSLGVRLFDVETGQETAFVATDRAVWSMKVSPDGRTLAAILLGGGDYVYPPGLWDVQTGELLAELPDESGWDSIGMSGMAFSPDGALLGTLDREKISVWASRTGQRLHTFPRTGTVLAFSPDGSQLFTDEWNSLVVWDLADEKELRRIKTRAQPVRRLALSPDGHIAAIQGRDMRLVSTQDGKELAVLEKFQDSQGEIVFSDDGSLVVVGGKIWETATGRLARTLDTGTGFHLPFFSPSLRFAAALPLLSSPDAVYLWDGASGEPRGPIFQSKTIGSFAFSPDGALLAFTNPSRRIELWEVGTQRFVERSFAPASEELGRPVFSPDGSLLAATDRNDILLWETALGGEPRRLQGHTEPVRCLAFAADGLSLFSGGQDNRLLQWDLQTGQPLRSPDSFRTDVVALVVSPDGALLVSGSKSAEIDRTFENPVYEHQPVRVWDAYTGDLLRSFNYSDVLSLEFSPDGRWLAAQLTIKPGLIDIQTGHHLQPLPNEGSPFVTNVAVHPGGRLLAFGLGREITLWDVAARQAVLSLTGNQNQLYRLAFSPDGKFLATSGEDGVLRLWRLVSSP